MFWKSVLVRGLHITTIVIFFLEALHRWRYFLYWQKKCYHVKTNVISNTTGNAPTHYILSLQTVIYKHLLLSWNHKRCYLIKFVILWLRLMDLSSYQLTRLVAFSSIDVKCIKFWFFILLTKNNFKLVSKESSLILLVICKVWIVKCSFSGQVLSLLLKLELLWGMPSTCN